MRENQTFLKTWAVLLGAVILGAALSLAAPLGPAVADDGTGYDPTGRGDALMPWAMGNAYKTHRDYAEDMGVSTCVGCHELGGVGYTLSGPGCLTCHGVKWDDGKVARNLSQPGHDLMNAALGVNWTNPQKQHRDYAEDMGITNCMGCHALDLGGMPDPPRGPAEGPGCLSCHGVKWDDDDDDRDDDDDDRDDDRDHDDDSS